MTNPTDALTAVAPSALECRFGINLGGESWCRRPATWRSIHEPRGVWCDEHKCEAVDVPITIAAPPKAGNESLVAELERMGELLRTQDNRITENPIFAVQQKRRIWNVEDGDGFEWRTVDDWDLVEGKKAARLEAEYELTRDVPKGFARVCYIDIWEFVTACLTEQGCKDYIAVNGHNLCEPRIFAYGGWRNAEWQWLRTFFMDRAAAALRTPATCDSAEIYTRPADVLTERPAEWKAEYMRLRMELETAAVGETFCNRLTVEANCTCYDCSRLAKARTDIDAHVLSAPVVRTDLASASSQSGSDTGAGSLEQGASNDGGTSTAGCKAYEPDEFLDCRNCGQGTRQHDVRTRYADFFENVERVRERKQ